MAEQLGMKVGLEFESFNEVNKKLKALIKQLEVANTFKIQIDTGTTNEIKRQLDKLSKTSLASLNSQYSSLANTSRTVANEQDRIAEKISNFQRTASVQISALQRQYGDLVPQKELQAFESRVNSLTGTSLPDVNKNIRDLRISFRELGEETKQNASQFQSFGNIAFDNIAKFATFFSVQQVARFFFDELRKGLESVVELDKTLTTLQITMDGNQEQFTELTDSASQLAIGMGSTIPVALELVRIYANLGESVESVTDKLQATIAISNLAGLSGSETADVIQGLVIQYGNSSEALLDTTTRVSDSLAAISSQLGVDFGKGLREISEGLRLSGSILTEYNTTLEESEALVGALIETTRRSGSEVARSLQFFSSRIFEVNESFQEQTGFINKAERQLNSMDVSIRNTDGSFRSFFDILRDTSVAMNDLDDSERAETASLIAGTRQRAQFLALMKSFPRVLELNEAALNSQGQALEKNEIFMESIEGRMNTLRAVTQEFWNTVINSDFIKNGITLLTDLVKSLDALAEGFGGNVAIMGAFASLIGTRGLIATGLKVVQSLLTGTTLAMTGLSVATVAATAGLALIPIILGKIIQHSREAEQRIKENTEAIKEMGKTKEQVTELLEEQEKLEEQLSNNTLKAEEYAETEERLREVQKQIATLLPDATNAENEYGEALATNIKLSREALQVEEERLAAIAQRTLAEFGGVTGAQGINERLNTLKQERDLLRGIREELAETGDESKRFINSFGQQDEIFAVDIPDYINDLNEQIDKYTKNINSYNEAAKAINKTNGESLPILNDLLDLEQEYETERQRLLEQKIRGFGKVDTDETEEETKELEKTPLIVEDTQETFEKQVDTMSILDAKIKDINSSLEKQQDVVSSISDEINMLDDTEENRFKRIKLINQQIEEQKRLEESIRDARQTLIQELGTVQSQLSEELGIDVGIASEEDLASAFNRIFSGQQTFGNEAEQEAFEQRLERVKQLMSDMETIQKEVANATKSIDDANKDIFDSQKGINDIAKDTLNTIQDTLKEKVEELFTDGEGLDGLKERSKLLQQQIDMLKEVNEQKQKEEDREKRLKAIEEARIRLQNAQAQRTVRLFTGERFEFVADPKAVQDAQAELDKLQEEHRTKTEQEQFEQTIRDLQKIKDANDEQIRLTEEAFRELENNLINFLNNEENLFGDSKLELNKIVDETFEELEKTYGSGIDSIIDSLIPKVNELNNLFRSMQSTYLQIQALGGGSVQNQFIPPTIPDIQTNPNVASSTSNDNSVNIENINMQSNNADEFLDRLRQFSTT